MERRHTFYLFHYNSTNHKNMAVLAGLCQQRDLWRVLCNGEMIPKVHRCGVIATYIRHVASGGLMRTYRVTHTHTPVWYSLAVLRVVRKYLTCARVDKWARLSTAHLVIESAVNLSEV